MLCWIGPTTVEHVAFAMQGLLCSAPWWTCAQFTACVVHSGSSTLSSSGAQCVPIRGCEDERGFLYVGNWGEEKRDMRSADSCISAKAPRGRHSPSFKTRYRRRHARSAGLPPPK